MAKNITLLGASYSDVPAVQLPQTGGGTARFDDCSVTTATASDVAQGKVFVASDGTVTTGTASGGGGASNIVTGTFKGTNAQKGTAININLPYTGSGYPVAIVVYPSDGPYNSNSTFYNLIQRYACCFLVGIKNIANAAPSYSGGADSMMTGYQYRKNSTSNATTYTGTVTTASITFSSSQAAGSNSLGIVNFSSSTQLSVFIANTSYGFAAGIEYTYQVVYSQ